MIETEIKSSTANDVYLISDAPAVLALMAGDALGPYAGKRVHLMQYDEERVDDKKVIRYVEVLVLPDEELDQMVKTGMAKAT